MQTGLNFIERMLACGFTRVVPDSEIKRGRYDVLWNPRNNWMGTVIYHPFDIFIKGRFSIKLSLEYYNASIYYSKDGKVIKEKISEKRIIIKDGEKEIYRNHYGVMPPKEIENMLK